MASNPKDGGDQVSKIQQLYRDKYLSQNPELPPNIDASRVARHRSVSQRQNTILGDPLPLDYLPKKTAIKVETAATPWNFPRSNQGSRSVSRSASFELERLEQEVDSSLFADISSIETKLHELEHRFQKEILSLELDIQETFISLENQLKSVKENLETTEKLVNHKSQAPQNIEDYRRPSNAAYELQQSHPNRISRWPPPSLNSSTSLPPSNSWRAFYMLIGAVFGMLALLGSFLLAD
ncbi:BA75_00658T0 [Komagataella pastoris]|uniref:BA75_00658T0 n=1 Tax=Komagataella pastoris TaxID=4922 RepID=A0A1B2JA46_PICPA|nr:BA75_00658T0 [Komagataella pastoris]